MLSQACLRLLLGNVETKSVYCAQVLPGDTPPAKLVAHVRTLANYTPDCSSFSDNMDMADDVARRLHRRVASSQEMAMGYSTSHATCPTCRALQGAWLDSWSTLRPDLNRSMRQVFATMSVQASVHTGSLPSFRHKASVQ